MSERKLNVEALSEESVDNLAQQAGVKINDILMVAKEECNKLLSRLGLQLELSYELKNKEESTPSPT